MLTTDIALPPSLNDVTATAEDNRCHAWRFEHAPTGLSYRTTGGISALEMGRFAFVASVPDEHRPHAQALLNLGRLDEAVELVKRLRPGTWQDPASAASGRFTVKSRAQRTPDR